MSGSANAYDYLFLGQALWAALYNYSVSCMLHAVCCPWKKLELIIPRTFKQYKPYLSLIVSILGDQMPYFYVRTKYTIWAVLPNSGDAQLQ